MQLFWLDIPQSGPEIQGTRQAELAGQLDKDLAALNAQAAQSGYPGIWVGGR